MVTDSTMYVQLRAERIARALVDDLKKNPGKIPIQVKIF
jgi:hypothetical protein